jgi:hypothetical protein
MSQVQRAVAHTGGHLDLVAVTAPEMVSLLVVPTPTPCSGTSIARHRDTGTGVGMSYRYTGRTQAPQHRRPVQYTV